MDIRKNRIDAQLKQVHGLVNSGDFKKAYGELKLIINELENLYTDQKGKVFNFSHILEVYYFSYFKKQPSADIKYCEYDLDDIYKLYGSILMKLKKTDLAIQAYNRVLIWNPVDIDALFQLAELYKMAGRIDSVKKITLESYPYCCTRMDMAKFYRDLGFYYLEKYKPEMAIALYQYSNIFYQTELADNELNYISKALNKVIDPLSVEAIQEMLDQKGIPKGPNPDTVGIAYQVGQLMLKEGKKREAFDCFTIVYDITQDEEVKKILESIT